MDIHGVSSMDIHGVSLRQEMSESSRNVRIVRIYTLTVLFTFTMVIINSILGLIIMHACPD